MPWANGRGVTWEVATGRSGSRAAPEESEWQWRLSIAIVDAPGPFSSLPGVDRLIAVASGNGMVLTVDGSEEVVEFGRPVAFSGDAVTTARLIDGPVRDLNLMTARGVFTGTMRIVSGACDIAIAAPTSGVRWVVAVGDDKAVLRSGSESLDLDPLDALADVDDDLAVSTGLVAVVDVVPFVDPVAVRPVDDIGSWHELPR